MHPSGVQSIVFRYASGKRFNTHKTGALCERFVTDTFDLFQFIAWFEWAILDAILYNILGPCGIQAGNMSGT